MAVAIHIANRNLVGLLTDCVGGGAGEGSVLVIQQYADGTRSSVDVGVGCHEVRIPVSIQIAGSDPEGLATDRIGAGGGEGTAAGAEQHLNIVVLQVADRDIETAIPVEVANRDAVGEV